jgi:hypothetical protein
LCDLCLAARASFARVGEFYSNHILETVG